jgi:hypothetical protein
MSIEDFIRKSYGSTTAGVGTGQKGSARALTLKEARALRSEQAKGSQTEREKSLADQRTDMRERRADYSAMIKAEVIPNVKTGRSLLDKMENEETRPEVVRYMARLDDDQMKRLKSVVDKNLKKRYNFLKAGIYIGGFNDMIDEAKKIRKQGGTKVDTSLGFGNLVKKGTEMIGNMVDEEGFSLDLDPFGGEYHLRYRKDF